MADNKREAGKFEEQTRHNGSKSDNMSCSDVAAQNLHKETLETVYKRLDEMEIKIDKLLEILV